MKKIIILSTFMAVALLSFNFQFQKFYSNNSDSSENQCVTKEKVFDSKEAEYMLDVKESNIQWQASYILGGGHQGTLNFESGKMYVSNKGNISKGDFVIAMNTIQNTDLEAENGKADLEKHLKSSDFFAVNQYPQAHFKIKKVNHFAKFNPFNKSEQISVLGELSIKGITRPLSFMAEIKKDEVGQTKLQAEIKIDRTHWGINYKSPSLLDNVKDGIIANEIKINLDLIFRPDGC